MNKVPNILVVSHNCFSKSGSNGRTLANFFLNWPKDSLAQFYISNEVPDSEVCEKYFRVTDIEALKAVYKGIKPLGAIKREENSNLNENVSFQKIYKKHRNRKSFNYIARNFVWDSNRWRSKYFEEWVDNFNPDIIVLQLGDYAFMLRIALKLAEKKRIPLVVYNSEDYFFKDIKSISPLYQYYRSDYKKQVRKLISYASCSVYNSNMLQQTYQNEFEHKSTVIMTSSDIIPVKNKEINSHIIVSYLGSLEVGRHVPLIEIAEILHNLDPNAYLDIYGKIPNKEVEAALNSCSGIRFKGFVSYDEVVEIIKISDLLVHAENFSEYSQWDLKHSFSTKIADYLASGNCFFVYAPKNMACVRYLMEKKAACIVTNKENLKDSLKSIIHDKDLRQSYIENALLTVKDNHSADYNADKFNNLLINIIKDGREKDENFTSECCL